MPGYGLKNPQFIFFLGGASKHRHNTSVHKDGMRGVCMSCEGRDQCGVGGQQGQGFRTQSFKVKFIEEKAERLASFRMPCCKCMSNGRMKTSRI